MDRWMDGMKDGWKEGRKESILFLCWNGVSQG